MSFLRERIAACRIEFNDDNILEPTLNDLAFKEKYYGELVNNDTKMLMINDIINLQRQSVEERTLKYNHRIATLHILINFYFPNYYV